MKPTNINYYDAVEAFIPKETGWPRICKLMIKQLRPDKKDWFGVALSCIGGVLAAFIIGCAEDTVRMTDTLCTVFLDIHVAIFGCILAAYSILLAFLDNKYIKKLLNIDYKENSNYLTAGVEYFESAMYIYVIGILLSLGVKLAVTCMPDDYILTNNHIVNELLAAVLLLGYLLYVIRTTYELKSVVANTASLFGGSLAFKIMAFAKEQEENNSTSDKDEETMCGTH